jgi:adenylate cyclase class 2
VAPDRTIISQLMGTATTLEREVKLSFESAESAREAVIAAGATPLHGRRLQEDALLDSPDGCLRERGCALRVRMEGGKSRITFKGPIQESPMKLRDEFETLVGDGVLLLRILEELGFQVWFRYEKYREEFAHEDVIVAIDETPVGVFVEIEGSERGIADMAAAMGREPADYILDSYRGLFLQHREASGLTGADMVFDPSE